MATTIGKLVVSLTTKTGRFRKGMKASIGRVASFASGIGSAVKKIAKFTAIITTAAVVGIAFFTKKAFESIDATAKLAKQTGLTIESLRGLTRAAKITGAGEAALVKGIGFLTKALGEAKTGIGEGKQALEEIGLSAEDLIDIPLFDAVGKIADRMNMLSTQSEKAFVASKLFGRGGLALINTLALGSKGLREMSEGAVILQGSLSAFDAAKVEEANDAVSDLRDTWTGFFERIAVTTAPFVKAAAENITKTLIFLRQNTRTIVPTVIGWLGGIGEATVLAIDTIVDEIGRIPDNFEIAGLLAVDLWNTFLTDMEVGTETWLADFKTGIDAIATASESGFAKTGAAVGGFLAKTNLAMAKWLLKGRNLNETTRKFLEDQVASSQLIIAEMTLFAADKSDKAWKGFADRTAKRTKDLRADIAKIRDESDALRKVLALKRGGLLGKEGIDIAGTIKEIVDRISAVELPKLSDDLEASLVKGGEGAAEAIKKAIRPPAAIERGTVEAFSATVAPTFRAMQDNSKSTVVELKENNRLQREGNRQFQAWAEGAVVTEFA